MKLSSELSNNAKLVVGLVLLVVFLCTLWMAWNMAGIQLLMPLDAATKGMGSIGLMLFGGLLAVAIIQYFRKQK